MAFLDDLNDRIESLGKNTERKVRDMSDSAKLSSTLRSLESQQRETYEQMGRLYYSACTGNGEQEAALQEMVRAIQNMEKEKSELRKKIQAIRGITFCPNCNAEIAVNSLYCNTCGYKMPVRIRACSQCGATLAEGQSFCVKCGTKV